MKKIYLILTIFGFLITCGYYATGQNTQCLAKSGCFRTIKEYLIVEHKGIIYAMTEQEVPVADVNK